MKQYLMDRTRELAYLLALPEQDFYTDHYLAQVALNYAQYRLSLRLRKGGVMAAPKTKILVVNLADHEVEVCNSIEEAQEYLDTYADDYDEDDIYVYEITRELELEETTRLSIID